MANPKLPGGTAFLAGFSRLGILRGHHHWLHKSRPSFTHLWEKPGGRSWLWCHTCPVSPSLGTAVEY